MKGLFLGSGSVLSSSEPSGAWFSLFLTISLCCFSLSSTVVRGKKNPLKPSQKSVWILTAGSKMPSGRERNGNTDFFQSHITIHPSTDIHVVLMCLSLQRLAWASRRSLSWWLLVVTCPSIHLLVPHWIWWPLGYAANPDVQSGLETPRGLTTGMSQRCR